MITGFSIHKNRDNTQLNNINPYCLPRKYYRLFYLQKKQKKLRNPEQGFRNNDILLYYWLFSCRSSSETARRNSSS